MKNNKKLLIKNLENYDIQILNAKEINIVFSKYSVIILIIVFTIWTLGEIAYFIGKSVNC